MIDTETIVFNVCAFVAGLFILESGADRFIEHTAVVARHLGCSPTLVALVTAGAEWEELAVVVAAISQGQSSLALGNVLGSSISNILGAFSLGLIFHSDVDVRFDKSSKIYTGILFAITTIVCLFLCIYQERLGRFTGGFLITVFLIYFGSIGYGIYRGVMAAQQDSHSDLELDSDSDSDSEDDSIVGDEESAIPLTEKAHKVVASSPLKPKEQHSLYYHLAKLAYGFFALTLSGYMLSHSVGVIADAFQLSGTLAGITVLSFATTLPEKLVAIMSGSRGQGSIVVANTAGSNIFLLTLCAGVLFAGGDLAQLSDSVTGFEILSTWLSAALFFGTVYFGCKRWLGGVMFMLYVLFVILEFTMFRR